jgi:fructoselysine-6-P-deglycase FrlB-like protein
LYSTAHQEAQHGSSSGVEGRTPLPLQHPHDYECRYTADAARALLNYAADLAPGGSDVLLFGTPGLAAEALTLPIGRRISLLVEQNSVTDR